MILFIERWKDKARQLKLEIFALFLVYQDPRVPRAARIIIACVVAYALSPIDLIPDFIPVLGYLDDLILLPIGIALAIRLIPADVMNDARHKSREINAQPHSPYSTMFAVMFVFVWILIIGFFTWIGWAAFQSIRARAG